MRRLESGQGGSDSSDSDAVVPPQGSWASALQTVADEAVADGKAGGEQDMQIDSDDDWPLSSDEPAPLASQPSEPPPLTDPPSIAPQITISEAVQSGLITAEFVAALMAHKMW